MSVTVLYFASLRDAAGVASEVVDQSGSLASLYEGLKSRYGFPLGHDQLRVAVDGEFAEWGAEIAYGTVVAFIPPVSGG